MNHEDDRLSFTQKLNALVAPSHDDMGFTTHEIIQNARPAIDAIATQLMSRQPDEFVDGLYELLDTASAPASRFNSRVSPDYTEVQFEFIKAVVEAMLTAPQSTNERMRDAVDVLSNYAHYSGKGPARPASRPIPEYRAVSRFPLRSPGR